MKHDPYRLPGNLSEPSKKAVFRSIAFPVEAFDHLKEFQRNHEQQQGVRLNNNEALTLILKQHRQFIAESEEHARIDD